MAETKKYTTSDVNNMKIWAFYLAQKKWNLKPTDCMKVFEDNKLFDCINYGYDYLHLMSYKNVVEELEDVIKAGKVQ